MPSEKPDFREGLSTRYRFPHPDAADADGFLAVGGDLKPGTLLLAYSNGIFPWTTSPITWWSPDPRTIIPMGGVHVSRSLARFLRRPGLTVTFDRAYRQVMEECARSRPGREETWISRRFITGYTQLQERGYGHSAEVWREGTLVGGIYGVSIGGFYAGESMFAAEDDASKVALVLMEQRLRESGFTLFDVQFLTPHLQSMGAVEIPRADYLARLRTAIAGESAFTKEPFTTGR
jgi:leucyl/phenylalanyl-tRNA--protein transferase